jgi:hypothetical protein
MNVLLILSALKKGWEYTKGFLALALKYWYIVIITLLLAIATSLRNDVNKLNAEKDVLNSNMVALVQKHKTDLLEAQKKSQEKEIEILTKQKEVEVKYNEQIKALNNDVIIAHNSANSLSKQLADNTVKLSTASKAEVSTYNKSISIVLEDIARKYLYMAVEADTKRLAEERCVGLYNALVDTDNKE